MFLLDISDINLLPEAAKKLLEYCGDEKILLFSADMGCGKTTFIKSLCRVLGSDDVINSPTYSIVNEYKTKDGDSIYHFDLYRLKSSQELFEIGFEDYLQSNNYVLIEWPELAMPFIDKYIKVKISKSNNKRLMDAEKY